jgi:hypothetical protein
MNEMEKGTRATQLLMRALDSLSDKCSLTDAEKLALLGLSDPGEWQVLHDTPLVELPPSFIERAFALRRIYELINTLLPAPGRADAWIRKPNKAPTFEGRSALQVMIDGDVDGLRLVRDFLLAQANGN